MDIELTPMTEDAFDMAYNNKEQYEIHKNKRGQWVVYDKYADNECYIFGESDYFAKLLLKYSDF